jgi:DNA-binding MarR family transcriptional regulator
MDIIRSAKHTGYTCIDNRVFQSGLSLGAMGLLSWFLSKPGHWMTSISGTEAQLCESRHTISKYLNELEEKGFFAKRSRIDGKFDWIVLDAPHPRSWDKAEGGH